MRIRRWKETVSTVQRARKKRYWTRIGWAARKASSAVGRAEVLVKVVVELLRG